MSASVDACLAEVDASIDAALVAVRTLDEPAASFSALHARESARAAVKLARAEGVASGLDGARRKIVQLGQLATALAESADDGAGSCWACGGDSGHEDEFDCPAVKLLAFVSGLPEAR